MISNSIRCLPNGAADQTVALIGGGIVNLVTAYYLVKQGYSVKLFDQSPDPTTRPDFRLLGCSAGGGDGRVFSLNEARHHFINSRHYSGEVTSPLKRTIAEDGNLAIPASTLTPRDIKWIQQFEAVTGELAAQVNRELVAFNRESEPLWQEMVAAHPELFHRAGYVPGLYRVYATQEKYTRALAAEQAIGSIKRSFSPAEIAKELPALRDAQAADTIAGVLEVTGFSVNIHKLVNQLIGYLSAHGAELHWQVKIEEIERNQQAQVVRLRAGKHHFEADHYVMSVGAYSTELLAGFLSADSVAAVIGHWLTIPNRTPQLTRPFKYSRDGFASKGACEGANVIPGHNHKGQPVIHISSGHGYIGFGHETQPYEDVMNLRRGVEETVRRLFPKQSEDLDLALCEPMKTCTRPWTPSGLGIFERANTQRGGAFIITGGHNTGGFAQAPAVAMAVLAALEHRHHPMHELYHPQRLEKLTGWK